ncbi:hypothetical protein BH23CHL8_BH23CHL8_27480 [soil metagenome]
MEGALPAAHHHCVGSTTRPSTERLATSSGLTGPDSTGDIAMGRYTELSLRVAVVAAFVLVLAAPFRW